MGLVSVASSGAVGIAEGGVYAMVAFAAGVVCIYVEVSRVRFHTYCAERSLGSVAYSIVMAKYDTSAVLVS
jgi:hypothetical protein